MSIANQHQQDSEKLLNLIKELPEHNGALPINDRKDASGNLVMGAHGEDGGLGAANKIEAQIAGIVKAYGVSSKLRALSAPGTDIQQTMKDITQLVTGYEGSEKPLKQAHEIDERIAAKIRQLDIGDDARNLVSFIVANTQIDAINERKGLPAENRTQSDAILAQYAGLEKITAQLKQGKASDVLTDAVKQAAAAKFYEITDSENGITVVNQSSVRLGYIPERHSHLQMPGAGEQYSDDTAQKQKSIAAYIHALKDSGAATLIPDENNTVNVFDIAHGNGKTAVAALQALKETLPEGTKIHYTGVDMSAGAHSGVENAIAEAGLKDVVSTQFITKTFGLPSIEGDLKELMGKQDLVIASHVYNVGDKTTFLKQIDELQKPTGTAFIAHEGNDTWIQGVRTRHAEKLREGSAMGEEFSKFLNGERIVNGEPTPRRDFERFTVPTSDIIPAYTDKELAILKALPQGKFTGDNLTAAAAALGESLTPEEHTALGKKRDLAEFFLRAPLEAFAPTDRGALLDDIQQQLVEKQGKLARNSEAQVVLSTHNKDRQLSEAVHAAAKATVRMLEPAATQEVTGAERFIGKAAGRGRG